MVNGPTPPGTGVMALATRAADSNSTSPTIRPSTMLMPTSTTTAPGLEHLAGDEARVPGGHDDDVGLAGPRGKVARPAVADRDRGVLLHEQERGRHADDRRATDDHGVATGDLDARPAQDLDRGVGRGRQEPVVAEAQQPGVERVDAVDVLVRIDGVDDGAQADRRRQRHLDDDAIDAGVRVELADRGDDRGLRRLAFELDEAGVDPDLGAAADDLLEVDGRGRVAPDDDDGEPGRSALRRR